MASQLRILIADDHALIRDSLRQLFAVFADIAVAGEAADGPDVLELLARGRIDLLLLDLRMPGLCGEALIAHIRSLYPDLPILVLSILNEAQIVLRALKAGANGYVAKGQDAEVLIDAIHEVALGRRFVDPSVVESLASAMAAEAAGMVRGSGLRAAL
jgi:DNA-binding NarL/FixJ family response regulator